MPTNMMRCRKARECDLPRLQSVPPSRSALTVAIFLLVGMLCVQKAHAQLSGGPIDIQLFRPAIDSKGYITLNASQPLAHLDFSFGPVLNYARRPLAFSGQASGGVWCSNPATLGSACASGDIITSRYVVENMATGNLQGALGLFGFLEIGMGLPFTLWAGDTDPAPGVDQEGDIDAQGVGDLAIHFKGRILNTSTFPVGLAIITSFSIPTGDDASFLGSGRFGIYPTLIVDREFFTGRLRLALNVGGRFRVGGTDGFTDARQCDLQDGSGQADCGSGRTLETGQQFTYGLGASYAIIPQRFDALLEVIGQTGFDGFFDTDKLNTSHELLAGFKLYLAQKSFLTFGVGRGLRGTGSNFQYGTPDVRAFLGFIFEPSIGDRDGDGIKDDVDKCPNDPEDFDDFEDEDGCPDPDNDGDGILDVDDKCRDEPEDKDGVDDEDGCPDRDINDRDGDGIPDDKDQCPDEPEDFDKFEDEDGCPDPDNDGDGILDVDDLCPNEPEDKDGFEDKDGCPDPDNDHDRILDQDDQCPLKPEIYNGIEDEDGCPDKSPVVVRRGKLEILEKVYFETAKAVIKRRSYRILNLVAATLQGNPEIRLVEVQGHADERGADDYNMRLTEARAQAVKQYLIDKGVDPARLRAKGYGETKPLLHGSNPRAWAKNRRVEFVILKREKQGSGS